MFYLLMTFKAMNKFNNTHSIDISFSCIFFSLFLFWWFAICFRFRNKLLFLDVILLFELFEESMKITHTYKEYDLYAHKLKHSISVHKCNATRHQPNHKELNGKIKTAQVVQKGEEFLWNYTFVCMFVWYGCFASFFLYKLLKSRLKFHPIFLENFFFFDFIITKRCFCKRARPLQHKMRKAKANIQNCFNSLNLFGMFESSCCF